VISSCASITNQTRTPAVALFNRKRHPTIDSITVDIDQAVSDAIEYLKELGHTEIGFAGEPLTLSKLKIFQAAMRKKGLPVRQKWIKTSSLRFEEAGMEMVEEWLREGTLPTAILAGYDNIAIGIIKALTERGYRVPEDVSVVGMDDISVAPFLEPPLSSIQTNTEETCRYAVELIMRKIEDSFAGERNPVLFPAKFIPRGSTGRVRQNEKNL
jgi:DNA-binding LacI/PurR family transcriptional regulator